MEIAKTPDIRLACIALIGDAMIDRFEMTARAVINAGIVPIRLERAIALPAAGQAQCFALIALDGPALDDEKLDIVRQLRESDAVVIVYGSAATDWPLAERCRARLAGAIELLDSSHPSFGERLISALRKLREDDAVGRQQLAALTQELAALGITGASAKLLAAYRSLSRVSMLSTVPILLLGETGTGKELFARAVHQLDTRRSAGPMVIFNSGSLQTELAESTLFGHRRGAFTGATEDRRGVFRAAHGGVLFMDEIGELSETLQARLLRVLETAKVRVVGEDAERPVDVRIVAATNRDLRAMADAGTFRPDLYHRLNVVAVRIPALRERLDDLPLLVDHLIRRHRSLANGRCEGAHPEAIEALVEGQWPGNVRQLENVVRWSLIHKTSFGQLLVSDLPSELWQRQAVPASPPSPALPADFEDVYERFGGRLADCMDYCERRFVETAIRRTGGNQSRAASSMGITPRSVYNKLRRLGLTA